MDKKLLNDEKIPPKTPQDYENDKTVNTILSKYDVDETWDEIIQKELENGELN